MLQSLEQSDMCHRGEQSHDQPPRGFGTQIYFQSVWIRILISSDQKISFNSKTMVSIRLTGTRVCIFGTTQKGREVRPVQRGRPLRPVQLPARQKRTQSLTERKTLSSQHKASHLGDLPFFFQPGDKAAAAREDKHNGFTSAFREVFRTLADSLAERIPTETLALSAHGQRETLKASLCV